MRLMKKGIKQSNHGKNITRLSAAISVMIGFSGAAIGAEVFHFKSSGFAMQTQIAKSDDTGCETKYLSANVAEKSSRASNQPYEFGPEIFVYVGSVNWCTGIARGGYAYFPATVAKLHGRLDTANFSGSGQIHIHDWTGSESVEKVSVDLTFMGDGDVTEQTNTSTHISPGYRLKARYKGLFRHAKVNGSVSVGNDITPIELSVGSMGETASMEMTVSK